MLFYICTLFLSPSSGRVISDVPPDSKPAKAATIEDILKENIPNPTIDRVSFPEFSYQQAWPDSTDEPELIIKEFNEAPMLANLDSMPSKWREHYPDVLPPVEERLPVNPAVTRGPDGIGNYGGVWHRVRSNNFAWERRIMYESLIRHDPTGQHTAALAYRWEMSDNNRVFTFYLRPGHKWSDGTPFTSHDIVFSHTLGNSPWTSDFRSWKQKVDGSNQIYLDDILDWQGLAKVILEHLKQETPNPSQQLFSEPGEFRVPTDENELTVDIDDLREKHEIMYKRIVEAQEEILPILKQISEMNDGQNPDEMMQGRMIDLLGVLLKNREYFQPEAWKDVDLESELKELKRIGQSRLNKEQFERYILLLEREDLFRDIDNVRSLSGTRGIHVKANVLAFRAAYRGYVAPARISQVKVEAIPDETGNDDHILRFTFEKPASYFLEKTTTFMFYYGQLTFPEWLSRKLHPFGSRILNTVDICDWPAFARILKDANESDTPVGRFREMLPEEIRDEIINRTPGRDTPEQIKQKLVDAINAVLMRRDFYKREIWAGIDFESELRGIVNDGLVKSFKKASVRYRYELLLVRSDLIRRVHEEGIDSLNEEELYDFNLYMFRPLFGQKINKNGEYDEDGIYTVVAIDRDAALNHEAQTGAKEYESWRRKRELLGLYYHPEYNRHRPTLQAWRVVTARKEKAQLAVRNPYYYRVDMAGNQLPYINAIENTEEPDREARLMKLKAGAVDMQDTEIRLEDFTVLKQYEKTGGYEVRLWPRDRCGTVAFTLNQNHGDPNYAKLFQNPRYRHALSLALNRQEIIDVVFNGLGRPTQLSIPRGSPYYSENLDKAYSHYDPQRANEILDEIGLDARGLDGMRMLRTIDGAIVPFVMIVSTDESRIPISSVEMACQYWRDVGINARMKLQRNLARLASTGDLDMAAAEGGGSYFGPLLAGDFAPTHPAECWQWNQWVSYLRSGGIRGMEPPDYLKELDRMWQKVSDSPDDEQKMKNWQALMDRTAYYIPVIGILEPPGELMYVTNAIKNVPEKALAGWIPHGPGNVCPELFYFVEGSEQLKD